SVMIWLAAIGFWTRIEISSVTSYGRILFLSAMPAQFLHQLVMQGRRKSHHDSMTNAWPASRITNSVVTNSVKEKSVRQFLAMDTASNTSKKQGRGET